VRSLKRIVNFASEFSQARHRDRAPRQVRRQFCLEALETRNLLSGGTAGIVPPGVSLQNGELCIIGTLKSGNTANVSINSVTHMVQGTLDGNPFAFPASQVTWISYMSGSGGHDQFSNSTGLFSLDVGYGGGNTFTNGTGVNEYILYGNGNTVHNNGGSDVVLTNGGQDNFDPADGGTQVTIL